MHDRPIARRLDDGVERLIDGAPLPLRLGRGSAPATLPLPPGFEAAPQVLALGGQMKAALCLLMPGRAVLSQHLGDQDMAAARAAWVSAKADLTRLYRHGPAIIACDLHHDMFATRQAEDIAAAQDLPLVRVQHHHAHLAACLGDAGWPLDGGPVAAIVLDGLGLGPDGSLWGGEVLLGDYRDATRVAHLLPAPLPGGDAAAREPWRNAVMRLDQAGLAGLADRLFPEAPRNAVRAAARAGVNAPMSSSAGRLYDAVAACLGLCPALQTHEAEAAMRLEALAEARPGEAPYPMGDGAAIDPAPMLRALAGDLGRVPAGVIAARFQTGLATAFVTRARALVTSGQAGAVALSGGCFQNAGLLAATRAALGDVRVLTHRRVPPGDGGLAFGQALVAAAHAIAGTIHG